MKQEQLAALHVAVSDILHTVISKIFGARLGQLEYRPIDQSDQILDKHRTV